MEFLIEPENQEYEEREQKLLEAAHRMRQAQAPIEMEMPSDMRDNFSQMDAWNTEHGQRPLSHDPIPKIEETEKPGVFEGIGHTWMDWSLTGSIAKDYQKSQFIANDIANDLNPGKDIIPQNWNASDNKALYAQVSPKYIDLLRMSKSPADQKARFNYALSEMKKDEYYSNGSLFQKFISKSIGIPAGILIDVPTLIPWGLSVKYAKISQNILYNAPRDAALIASISGTEEAIKYGIDPDKTVEDAGYDVLFNTIAGTAMMGAGRGLMGAWKGYRMRDAIPKELEFNSDGIGPSYHVDENGDVTGVSAVTTNSDSLSAAKVSHADLFYGSQLAKTGLFWFPKTSNLFKPFSPIFRGLSSDNGVLKHYTNVMTSHGINTIAGKKYVPDQSSFQDKMFSLEGAAQQFGVMTEGFRKSYNGLDLSLPEKESLSKLNSTFNKKNPEDPASFGYQVANAVILKETHQNPQVNQAKTAWEEFSNKISNRYLKAFGKNENTYNMWNDEGYFTRVYNRGAMSLDKKGFISWGVNEIKELDSIIKDVQTPIRESMETMDFHQQRILDGIDVEYHREQLVNAKEAHKAAVDEVHDQIETRPDLNLLLEDPHYLTRSDRAGLKGFMKPLETAEKDMGTFKSELSSLKKKRSTIKSRLNKPSKKKTEEGIQKEFEIQRAKMYEIEKLIEAQEEKIGEHEVSIMDIEREMRGKAHAKEIPESWFYKHPDTGIIKFREYNKAPKFRPLYRDLEHSSGVNPLEEEMTGLWETLMNLSDDEIASSAMKNFHDFAHENPNRQRSVMLRTKSLLSGGWLKTDLPGMAHNYAMSVGKAAAREESLSQFKTRYGTSTGIEGVYKALRDDHKTKLHHIENLPEKERIKATKKENGDYDSNLKFMRRFDDALMGIKSGDRTVDQYATILKNLAAGSKLGNTFLSQPADMMGMVFKNGPLSFVRDGLAPAIKSMNGLIKSKSGEQYKEYASEANIGIEGYRTSMTKKYYGSDTYNSITPNNSVARHIAGYANSFAKATSKFTLMDFMENLNRTMAASTTQSRIMKWIHQAADGKLSEKNRRNLSLLGIEANDWKDTFIKQFNEHGSKGISGGYQSNYYLWGDTAAKNKMGSAINMSVNGTIIKRQVGNEPLALNNPVLSLFTQFMGWGFSSFNRFTIPMLQRADANMVIGAIGMGMMAVLEEISRKWARGEEVDMDSDEMLIAAFSNSAPFVMPYKAAMFANGLMDSDTLNKLKNDKTKNIMQLGMVGGPGLGFLKDFASSTEMFASGKWNQEGFKQAAKMIPGTQWWWTQRMADMIRESYTDGLPKTKRTAPGYWE